MQITLCFCQWRLRLSIQVLMLPTSVSPIGVILQIYFVLSGLLVLIRDTSWSYFCSNNSFSVFDKKKNHLENSDPHYLRLSSLSKPRDPSQWSAGWIFLAHRKRISEILPCDRKFHLTNAILPRTSRNVIMWNCILAYTSTSGSLF